jgi:prepilin-type N-terminal cleavage/methylation domain-containing protein
MRTRNRSAQGTTGVRAFTLIELLIVIAIVGVLISLVIPSMQGARAAARSGLCLAREKGLWVYVEMYRADRKNWYPTNRTWLQTGTTAPITEPDNQLGRFLVQIRPYYNDALRNDRNADASKNQLLCPGTGYVPKTDYDINYIREHAYVDDGVQLLSYNPNAHFGYGSLNSQGREWWPKREIRNVSPSRFLVNADQYGTTADLGYNNSTNEIRMTHPNNSFNGLFGDGSARNLVGSPAGLVTNGTIVIRPPFTF